MGKIKNIKNTILILIIFSLVFFNFLQIKIDASVVPQKILNDINSTNKKYIVKLKDVNKGLSGKNILKKSSSKVINSNKWVNITINKNQDLDNLKNDPNVEQITKDIPRKPSLIPNDTYYSKQWNLTHINAQSGWDTTTGSQNTIVAVIDTGIDLTHPDLINNIWTNSGEIGATASEGVAPNCTSTSQTLDKKCNNLDDDGNGKIDDIYGWNFADNNNNVQDIDTTDGHGTHVAGIIAAQSNNNGGVSGICWNCKIMPLRVFDTNMQAWDSDIANAIYYAVDNGAKVINMSLGGSGYSPTIQDALDYAWSHNVLSLSASGNESSSASDSYPSGLNHTLSVGSTDQTDTASYFSNTGPKLDISAPGEVILSTRLQSITGNCYGTSGPYFCLSGTSMATPNVSGVAALLYDLHRGDANWNVNQIRYALLKYGNSSNFDNTLGFRILNMSTSLASTLSSSDTTYPISLLDTPTSSNIGGNWNITGTASDSNLYIYTINFIQKSSGSIIKQVSGRNNVSSGGQLYSFDTTKLPNDNYNVTLRVEDFSGNTTVSNTINVNIDNSAPSSFNLLTPINNSWANTKPTLSWNSSSSNSPVNYDVYIDGISIANNLTTTNYTITSDLTSGAHSWYVIAHNSSSTTTQSSTQNFNVDNTPPLDFNINSSISGSNASFTFSTTDNESGLSHYDVILNSVTSTNVSSPYNLINLNDGSYSFTLNVYDNVGNVRSKTINFDITARVAYLKTKGDITGNGKVDLSDLSILAQNFGKQTTLGDINNDGKVDLSDLSILAQDWGKSY